MGFLKKNEQKKEETDSAEKKEYSFPDDVELKACRYCQVMIPKTAKVCPNCRKRLKKNWPGIFLLLCLLAAGAAGIYYYVTVYSVPEPVSADVEAVRSEETVQDAVLQDENLPEISSAFEGTMDFTPDKNNGLMAVPETEDEAVKASEADGGGEPEKAPEADEGGEPEKASEADEGGEPEKASEADEGGEPEKASEADKEDEAGKASGIDKEDEGGNASRIDKEDEAGNASEIDKAEEPENASEAEKEEKAGKDDENVTKRGTEDEEAAAEKDHAGMVADDEAAAGESGAEADADADIADDIVEMIDISVYTEEAFRDICKTVDYRNLLRRQDLYLNTAVTEELTVMEQVDGGLFDENVYYLCKKEDEQGITRYYIIRDDREEDAEPILEGDVLRVYGQLFGNCKLPGYLIRTQPTVPALTMVYYDLIEG